MDYLEQHPWRALLITPIETSISEEITEANPRWEYLEVEMVKLGSLAHEKFDLNEVQQNALFLLSRESKDLRIMAHLLRTLQQSNLVLDWLLGLQLFCDYIEHYWKDAAPRSNIKKIRLGSQIIKRFEKCADNFRIEASRLEKEAAEALFDKICLLLKDSKLADEIGELRQHYLLSVATTDENKIGLQSAPLQHSPPKKQQSQPVEIKPIEIETSNERAWKNTLFKVVDYLIEKDLSSPIGYQLRRYAIWSGITALPLEENNKTPLAPPPMDKVSNYEMALDQPTIETWKDIEHSLTVSPYWFYGHYLSGQIAEKLGYKSVSVAIRQALIEFIQRLPRLTELKFNDDSAFLPDVVRHWLEGEKPSQSHPSENKVLFEQLENASLDDIFYQLNEREHQSMRDKFYDQLLLAKLLDKKGLMHLATQHYFGIYQALNHYSVKEWEGDLQKFLEERLNIH